MDFVFPFDFPILEYIQSFFRNEITDVFFPAITHLGDGGIVWIVLTAILLLFKKTRKIGFCCVFALAVNYVIVNLGLKPVVNRTRPYNMENEYLAYGLELLTKIQLDPSFPSGHTSASFASATGIFAYNRKMGIAAFITAVLIGFSRLYVAVHFPSDVFAGVIIGIICGVIAYFINEGIIKAVNKKKEEKAAGADKVE